MTAGSRPPPLARIPAEVAAVHDYLALARERVEPAHWAYLNAAAGDGQTAADNVAALQALRLWPRVLPEACTPSTAVSLFGHTLPYPVVLAPVAYQQLAHPDGERATVLGAGAMQATMVVSTQASVSLEALASQAAAPLWFQLYLQPTTEATMALVARAEAAGYRALVVTLDAPISGLRNAEQRAGFVLPPQVRAVNLAATPPALVARPDTDQTLCGPLRVATPSWADLAALVRHTRLPVVAKGIVHPDDARRALDAGCAGIIVSNHGGRVLDTVPATIQTLPAVVAAVQGQVPVLLDGGIRRGTDIVKALALGARAVLVGRPQVWGLAAAGATGVAHVLHILRTELEMAMLLTGRLRVADLDPSVLWRAGEVGRGSRSFEDLV